jgi:hypothetical protein
MFLLLFLHDDRRIRIRIHTSNESGSGRPKNMWIRIRIRIRNTGFHSENDPGESILGRSA